MVMFRLIFITNNYAQKIEECDCPSKIAEKCSDNCCGLMGNVNVTRLTTIVEILKILIQNFYE